MNPVPLPPPQAVALWVLSTGAMFLQESIERYGTGYCVICDTISSATYFLVSP